jgi:hypothetical protein
MYLHPEAPHPASLHPSMVVLLKRSVDADFVFAVLVDNFACNKSQHETFTSETERYFMFTDLRSLPQQLSEDSLVLF